MNDPSDAGTTTNMTHNGIHYMGTTFLGENISVSYIR